MSKLLNDLIEVRHRISKGWTRGHWARTSGGRPVDYLHPRAVRFCITGAIGKVVPDTRQLSVKIALREQTDSSHLVWFNDAGGRTKAEVIALVDRAIGAAK